MSTLFSPITLKDMQLRNRIMVSPMCQYSAREGQATEWHLMHLGGLALSGASLLCIEASAVEAAGRITLGDLGLWNEAQEAGLRPVIAAIRAHSPIAVAMQLAHAGRKASCALPWDGGLQLPVARGGWTTEAPSAIAMLEGERSPSALDASGLERLRQSFAAAAGRAARLGLDALEVHGAHGYLLHEFLSPLSNQRTDEYGGSLANRMRFPLEIFDVVRAAFPAQKPVGVRVSATDWVEGGWNLEQTIAFAQELERRGADWIDVSSGGLSAQQKIPAEPGYQVPFAAAIKQATGLTTIAVGLITQASQAETILTAGQADIIALARAMLYDPRWGWHAAAEMGATATAPPQYLRAAPHGHAQLFAT